MVVGPRRTKISCILVNRSLNYPHKLVKAITRGNHSYILPALKYVLCPHLLVRTCTATTVASMSYWPAWSSLGGVLAPGS